MHREKATLHDGPGPGLELAIGDIPPVDPKKGVDEGDGFSAAAFAPKVEGAKDPRMIALGTRRSGVVLWSWIRTGPMASVGWAGKFDIQVETLGFTTTKDGLWLVASGRDKRFTAWKQGPSGRFDEVTIEPSGPRHDAVIRDIKTWPDLAMIATAGDDATVRFWSLKDRQLIGTIAFSRVGTDVEAALNGSPSARTADTTARLAGRNC